MKKRIKWSGVIACELFTLFTFIKMLAKKEYSNLIVCLITFVLCILPFIVEKLFYCKINTIAYIFILFYTICPMLGDCYQLYYITTWWDKFLHAFGGVVFALFGIYLFHFLNGKSTKAVAVVLFAVCFSIALSVVWEFIEFGADTFFGTDMQRDTVITTIRSYNLGDDIGVMGTIDGIENVTVNGCELPVKGYLDIGLIDTMKDMLWEAFGALIVGVMYFLDKGEHQIFIPDNSDKTAYVEMKS